MTFAGFPSNPPTLPVPTQVFTDLLPAIDHLGELKATLYALWRLEQKEGGVRFLRRADFLADSAFMSGMGKIRQEAEIHLQDALDRAVRRGVLLQTTLTGPDGTAETLYFLHTPRGRAALEGLKRGEWHPDHLHDAVPAPPEPPNIFRLYEAHIGPLTPLIADSLRDAETAYPPEWITDAFRIAAENNVRKWRYVEAILQSWQEKGRDDRKNLRDPEKDRRKYTQGEFSDFIEH